MQVIKSVLEVIAFLISSVWKIAISFWDLLGIGDYLLNTIIFWCVILLMLITGTCVSAKNKKKIRTGIFVAADIITFIGAIISAEKI